MQLKFSRPDTQGAAVANRQGPHVGSAVVTIENPLLAGSGPCKACSCKGYRPNNPKNEYCKDCGHSWYMHKSVS